MFILGYKSKSKNHEIFKIKKLYEIQINTKSPRLRRYFNALDMKDMNVCIIGVIRN